MRLHRPPLCLGRGQDMGWAGPEPEGAGPTLPTPGNGKRKEGPKRPGGPPEFGGSPLTPPPPDHVSPGCLWGGVGGGEGTPGHLGALLGWVGVTRRPGCPPSPPPQEPVGASGAPPVMDATYAVVNKTRRGGGAGGRDSTPFGRETASFDRDHAPFGKDPAPPGTPPSLPGSPLWRPSPTLAGEFGGGGGWRGAGGGPYSIHMTPSPHRCAYGSLSRPYRGWMIPPPHPTGAILASPAPYRFYRVVCVPRFYRVMPPFAPYRYYRVPLPAPSGFYWMPPPHRTGSIGYHPPVPYRVFSALPFPHEMPPVSIGSICFLPDPYRDHRNTTPHPLVKHF